MCSLALFTLLQHSGQSMKQCHPAPTGTGRGRGILAPKPTPTDVLPSPPDPDSPSLRLSSKVILVCVRLTVKDNHHSASEAWGIHNISEAKSLGGVSDVIT